MATDWTAVCIPCRVGMHLGHDFPSGACFGYGYGDVEGRSDAADFVARHVWHGDLCIQRTNEVAGDIRVLSEEADTKDEESGLKRAVVDTEEWMVDGRPIHVPRNLPDADKWKMLERAKGRT